MVHRYNNPYEWGFGFRTYCFIYFQSVLPFEMTGSEYALQARLKAKPERADEVAEFLESALPMAEDEEGTTTWFALRLDETTFGIFDTFPDEAARQAHLDGDIAAALMENADELLAEDPQIDEVDVLAAKHP